LKKPVDVVRVSKTINAPLRYVYDWCTDYRDDDPQIIDSKRQKKMLEKTKKRAIYVEIYDGADGKQKVAVNIVILKPPNSWHLDFYGEEDYEEGEYKLKSLGRGKTRLDMIFKESWKIADPPSLDEQVEQASKIWDKYVTALENDYRLKNNKM
jgi:hypothetical protein